MDSLVEKQGYVTIPLKEYKRLISLEPENIIDFKYNVKIDICKDTIPFGVLEIKRSHFVNGKCDIRGILEDILKLAINLEFGSLLENKIQHIFRLEHYCEEHEHEISKLEITIKNYKEEVETMKNIKSKWWYKLFYKNN